MLIFFVILFFIYFFWSGSNRCQTSAFVLSKTLVTDMSPAYYYGYHSRTFCGSVFRCESRRDLEAEYRLQRLTLLQPLVRHSEHFADVFKLVLVVHWSRSVGAVKWLCNTNLTINLQYKSLNLYIIGRDESIPKFIHFRYRFLKNQFSIPIPLM